MSARLIFLLVLISMVLAGPALAQEPEVVLKKVAVFPFAVLAKEPREALGAKVREEFQERLKTEGFTLVPPEEVDRQVAALREPVSEPAAREIGHRLGADVVLFGRLVIVADLLSLEARILDLTGKMAPAALKAEGVGLTSLSGLSRQLAQEASLKILGKERITRIDTKGNRRIDKDAILSVMQTREGEIISPARLREDLKAIFKMGYFTNVKFDVSDTAEGRILTVVVQEKPAIRRIVVQGNRKIKEKKILDAIDLKPFTVASETAIRENVAKIQKLYTEKGFYQAKVDYELQPITDTESDLVFKIDEGGKVYVKEIKFEGNHAFKDKQLRGVMETKEKSLISFITGSGRLNREILERDVEKVAAFYFNHGYVRAKVGEPRVDIRQGNIYITIPVEEGPQFTVGKVDIQGDFIEDKAKLRERLAIVKEKVYSREVVQQDLTTLADLYADHGYANADVTPLIKEDDVNKKVDIVFDIRQGKKVYIERIEISGNVKTRDKVIRRELRVHEQELFSATKLKESMRNLRRLEYFEDVNFSTTPGTSPDRMNLKVAVKERPTGSFGIGAGYSTQDRLVGMVEISQTNLFGRGQQLRLQGIIGAISNRFRLSFTEPYLFDRPLSFGLDGFNWEREFDEYTRHSYGGSLRLGHPLRWKYTRLYGSYRFEYVDLKDLRRNTSTVLREAATIHTTSAVAMSLRRDSRDALFMPTKGSDNSLSMEMAGLGGDTAFMRFIAESGWYFPLWWKTVAVVHTRGGYMSKLPWGELPAYEKFYLGGIDTIRGFNFAEISPRDPRTNERIGGTSFSQINLEYRWPVPFLAKFGIMGTVFFDAGNVYGANYVPPVLRTSVGGGVRWYSPMGPLRIEWGYNLNPEPYERKSVWEFTVGGTF
ncbi:MAG: outer membrane protein assembly factor BamA [Deltaproteobacteria bacterium]|nr:outer membrane protein assembly factor BamA [Deltaproteobacteria bacterium]